MKHTKSKSKVKKRKSLNNYMFIFYGPAGSGKSTQAKLITEKFGANLIIMGDLLRQIAKKPTPFGKKIKKIIEAGVLIDDLAAIEIIGGHLNSLTNKSKLIIDGFPRSIAQARRLDEFLKLYDYKNKLIFLHIKLTMSVIIKRLSSRRVCEKCGKISSVKKSETVICKKCGVPMVRRFDETPQAIRERLQIYQDQSRLLSRYYKNRILEINGNSDIKSIFNKIISGLGKELR